jgi:hypothetical protein
LAPIKQALGCWDGDYLSRPFPQSIKKEAMHICGFAPFHAIPFHPWQLDARKWHGQFDFPNTISLKFLLVN